MNPNLALKPTKLQEPLRVFKLWAQGNDRGHSQSESTERETKNPAGDSPKQTAISVSTEQHTWRAFFSFLHRKWSCRRSRSDKRLESLKLQHYSSYTASPYLLVHSSEAVMIVEALLESLLQCSGDKI